MIKVGVVPLDSRPCNTSWLIQLGESVNYQMIMYPISKCGTLHQGANIYNIVEWINSQAQKLDYLIISGDGFAFGGLIQAREARINLEEVLPLLGVLKEVKEKYPKLKIYLFDTIMRTSISATNMETGKYWALMNQYSKAMGRYYFLKHQEDLDIMNDLETKIPKTIIETYLKARRKKLDVTKYYLRLVSEKVIDEMIILQEDSMPYGIQKKDQEELVEIVKEFGLTDKINFYNGTDEGGVVLLAKIMLENGNINKNIYIHVPNEAILEKCCLFEDRPLKENIEKMLKTIGLNITNHLEDASIVFSIFARTINIDLDLNQYEELILEKDEVYQEYIKSLKKLMENYPVTLVDLYFPNGGSFELLQEIGYKKLVNYSAWNTASNSLGSAICATTAYLVNGNNETLENFKNARIMDDCIYQYIVRRKVNAYLLNKEVNIYDLGEHGKATVSMIKEMMHQYDYLIDNQPYEITLPWNRTFEAEIEMKQAKTNHYDCIVGGAGPAGICAAVSLARNGKKVLLIEKNAMIGGTNILSLVGPLMTYHDNQKQIIGGIASEIIDRLVEKKGTLGHISDPLGFCSTVTPFDVETLKEVYFEMIEEAGVELLLHSLITNVKTISKQNDLSSVKEIEVATPLKMNFKADYFIDATGDGYICDFAKAESFIGRSSDHLCQPMTMPFIVGNVDLDKLRLSMKEEPQNFVLNEKYDFKYVGVSGFFKEVEKAKQENNFHIERDRVLLFENVKANEVTINMTRVQKYSSLDVFELTKAELEGRKQVKEVFQFLKHYIPGFENSYIVTTPYQIGVRESRHIVCEYIMTKEDILNNQTFDDAIVKGAFPMDIHSPSGNILELIEQKELQYQIPLRSIIVKGFDNLLVAGRLIGATHEAAASLRVTPVAMALGEAAGLAINEAIHKKQSIREIDASIFSNILMEKGK